ncbi:hypothetical protein I6E29_07730 [Arcanobacterium haemolyticum]|nr:hypothetical protein [Arcanobacterium haemolyticum]
MSSGFSKAEQDAMKQRAAELRAERGGKKKAEWLESLLEAIEAMPEADRAIAVGVHQIVSEVAPELSPRTWYGFPAYERDGKVLVFVQPAAKFDTRYTTLGFQDNAALDRGAMWPTSFAITEMNDDVAAQIRELVTRAVGK